MKKDTYFKVIMQSFVQQFCVTTAPYLTSVLRWICFNSDRTLISMLLDVEGLHTFGLGVLSFLTFLQFVVIGLSDVSQLVTNGVFPVSNVTNYTDYCDNCFIC
uniref:Uncharacterized protein n=1 Tax=Glossina pallidipes TaxID=7398 RepID=A0A1B0AC76_GLOPL